MVYSKTEYMPNSERKLITPGLFLLMFVNISLTTLWSELIIN